MSGYLNLPITVERNGTIYNVQRNGKGVTFPYSLDTVDWEVWIESERSNGRDVTVNNSAYIDTTEKSLVLTRSTSDAVEINDWGSSMEGNFAIEGWIKLTGALGTNTFTVIDENYNIIRVAWDGAKHVLEFQFDATPHILSDTTDFATYVGEWVHFAACTADGKNSLYVNGIKVASSTGDFSNIAGGNSKLCIGKTQSNTNYWNGEIGRLHLSVGTDRGYGRPTMRVIPRDVIIEPDAYTLALCNFNSVISSSIAEESLTTVTYKIGSFSEEGSSAIDKRKYTSVFGGVTGFPTLTSTGVLTMSDTTTGQWLAGESSSFSNTVFTISYHWNQTAAGSSARSAVFTLGLVGGSFVMERNESSGGFVATTPSGSSTFVTAVTEADFRIRRDASNMVYCEYNIGAGWVTLRSETNSGNVTGHFFQEISNSSGTTTSEISNFSVVDSNGKEITFSAANDFSANYVERIIDQSNTTNDMVLNTGTLSYDIDNETVDFDGSDILFFTDINIDLQEDYTVFGAIDFQTNTAGFRYILAMLDTAGGGTGLSIINDDVGLDIVLQYQGPAKEIIYDIPNGKAVFAVAVDSVANELRLYVNGTLIEAVDATNYISTFNAGPFEIGRNWTGGLMAMLIYNGRIDQKDFRRVNQYLQAKYGIN